MWSKDNYILFQVYERERDSLLTKGEPQLGFWGIPPPTDSDHILTLC